MAEHRQLSLARLDTDVLLETWRKIAKLAAKSRVSDEDIPSDSARNALADVLGQPAWLVASLLEAVLCERGHFSEALPLATDDAAAQEHEKPPIAQYRIDRRYGTFSPELVWSGETGPASCARATRFVIDDLFTSARRSVFVAGYSFDTARELFTPLFERAKKLAERGEPLFGFRVVLDCSRTDGRTEHEIAAATGRKFRDVCLAGAHLDVDLRYYSPSTDRRPSKKYPGTLYAPNSMHAKCIIVDNETALVGSANFSTRGRDNRSVEVGALIRDHHFVQSLVQTWRAVEHDLKVCPD